MKEQILTPDVIREYHRQHRAIYEAIDQRDAARAQALITEHLGKARDDLLAGEQPLARSPDERSEIRDSVTWSRISLRSIRVRTPSGGEFSAALLRVRSKNRGRASAPGCAGALP